MNLQLPLLYYTSITAVVVFASLIYLLRVDLWPSPEKPRRALFFSLLGNAWLLTNLAMAVYLSLVEPVPLFFTDSIMWKIIAVILIGIASSITVWAIAFFRSMRRIFGMEVVKIITEGPYRYTRHPQYFAVILYTLALFFLLNTLQALFYALSTSISFYITALMEERKLSLLFPEEYPPYKERIPFFPFLKWKARKRKI